MSTSSVSASISLDNFSGGEAQPAQRAPKLTAEEKKLQAIEKQISAQDRIAAANARIAELDAERLANMTPGQLVLKSFFDTLKMLLKLISPMFLI